MTTPNWEDNQHIYELSSTIFEAVRHLFVDDGSEQFNWAWATDERATREQHDACVRAAEKVLDQLGRMLLREALKPPPPPPRRPRGFVVQP